MATSTHFGNFSYLSLATPATSGIYKEKFPLVSDYEMVLRCLNDFEEAHPDKKILSFHIDKFFQTGMGLQQEFIRGIYVYHENKSINAISSL